MMTTQKSRAIDHRGPVNHKAWRIRIFAARQRYGDTNIRPVNYGLVCTLEEGIYRAIQTSVWERSRLVVIAIMSEWNGKCENRQGIASQPNYSRVFHTPYGGRHQKSWTALVVALTLRWESNPKTFP